MRFEIPLLVAALAVPAFPDTVFARTPDLKKCIGAMNAFGSSIKSGKSEIDSHWIRGRMGDLLMKSSSSMNTLSKHIGRKEDIWSCTSFGVSPEDLELFVFAYHGYLPEDPFEGIAECNSTILTLKFELLKAVGAKKAKSIEQFIGERFAEAMVQLNYLYRSSEQPLEKVWARSAEISSSVSAMPEPQKEALLQEHASKCSRYGIPMTGALRGAGITLATNRSLQRMLADEK